VHAFRSVLLYRTPSAWRTTVLDAAGGMTCGELRGTPPDAPPEVARRALEERLRSMPAWRSGFSGSDDSAPVGGLVWRQTGPDEWIAEPAETAG